MKNLTKAILAVSQEVTAIEKSMSVGTGSSSYKAVSDSLVRNTLRPEMIKQGLVILPISVEAKTRVDRWEEVDSYSKTGAMKSKQSIFTETITKYMLVHQDSGESIELAGYGHGVDSQDKGAGKATTYALKNTLLDLFLITKGEDFDTDATHSGDMAIPKIAPDEARKNAEKAISSSNNLDVLAEVEANIKKSKILTAKDKEELSFLANERRVDFDPTK
jgi:ERF superfamily